MYEAIKKELYKFNFLSELSNDELHRLINSVFLRQKGHAALSESEKEALIEKVFRSVRGLGILDELLSDDSVSEIMINGYDKIFVEKCGAIYKTSLMFDNDKDLNDTIQRLVGKSGREVNAASPIVDIHLASGERVNVVLPPVSLVGSVVTIRRFPKDRMRMDDLIDRGFISEEAAEFLKVLVKHKYNIFVSGGTGSGKTTFLNVLSDYIPKDERVITIEDSAELQITGIENLICLEARNANTSGSGEVPIKELIRASLRMRPDRIIVGEVRGEEALDMLNAMNTGHDGSLSTGHANSSMDMIYRLETMILQSGVTFPLNAIRQHVVSAIDIIVHLYKDGNGVRKVSEISELDRVKDGEVILNKLYISKNGTLARGKTGLIHTEKMGLYGGESKIENQA